MLTKAILQGGTALAKIVRELYQAGQTDYYLEPIILTDSNAQPIGRIQDGDGVIFCCRRGEREIQLTEAFTERDFHYFPRPDFQNLSFVILTLYHEKFKDLPVAFAPTKVRNTLGEIVSRAGLRQLRAAESEKFAHVTFFLNGSGSQPFKGEDDVRIPSPKGVLVNDVPELSLAQVSEEVKTGIERRYDLIVTNFANGDVIGHTSDCSAKVKCSVIIDEYLGQVVNTAFEADYLVMITADHGNLEVMTHPDGTPHVSHTSNRVPFILIDPASTLTPNLRDGKLADIAPTVLSALGLEQPAAMDGESLIPGYHWGEKRRVLLIILDGWGIGQKNDRNPIYLADTPIWDGFLQRYPYSRLMASGEAVGLRNGKPGNSEAGHMNIGAGRVILQDDVRLDRSMQDGSFYENGTFLRVMDDVKYRDASLHLIAMLSEKSSHGSIDYPLALLRMAKERGLEQVYVHVIFDGRSTEPGSAPDLLEKFEARINEIGTGQIVSGIGRGIALDRDGNYAKTQSAFNALVFGTGRKAVLG